ncbi:DUF6382 domain-containing protein [Clostridium sp. AM58-1XD]|uniref:DUF6382 domain-containing protein n=1 Tax=Clostridium sp. AM58-1XD TaxID=2292307 RepID=UPI000E52EF31|nr:DUF6382 domain-containing protein [Clostridium sp. AM58-1XD]RGZ01876.1 FHA domain-containing protein [Clostridium sp. AM58-1XD]
MKKFTFENQGTDTYLVYHVGSDEKVDSFAKGMLQNNEIEGVLKPAFVQKDAEQFLKYSITSKMPLEEYFREKMTKHKIMDIFRSIIKGLESAEEYMLMPEGFLLDMADIYVDISARKASLIYLPLEEQKGGQSLKKFYKSMLTEITYDEHEDMGYIGKLINYLNQAKEPGMKELDHFLEQLDSTAEVKTDQKAAPAARPAGPVQQPKGAVNMNNGPVVRKDTPPVSGAPFRPQPEAAAHSVMPVQPEAAGTYHNIPSAVPPVQGQSQQAGMMPPVMPPVNIQQPAAEQKKKGFALFNGNPEKKAIKEAEKAAKEAAKAAKKAAKKGGKAAETYPGIPDALKAPGAPAVPGQQPIPGVPGVQSGSGMKGAPGQPAAPFIPQVGGIAKPPVTPPPVRNEFVQPPQPHQPGRPPVFENAPVQPPVFGRQPSDSFRPAPVQKPVPQSFMGGSADDDENRTIIIGGESADDSSTMMLGGSKGAAGVEGRNLRATVIRRRNGQSMVINKLIFHMGKESSFADFYIGDNATVSSAHADIICDGSQFFIRDMNSLNHTYVNGILVEAGEMRELHSGDVLKLSNEEFDFRVE